MAFTTVKAAKEVMPYALSQLLTRSGIRIEEVIIRNKIAREILAGFRQAMPTLESVWQYLETSMNDAPAIVEEISRLSAELDHARIDSANLLAAMRAAIHAEDDGEPDPMWYIRDELAHHMASQAPYGPPGPPRRQK